MTDSVRFGSGPGYPVSSVAAEYRAQKVASKPAKPADEKKSAANEVSKEKASDAPSSLALSDVRLRFQVDQETHDVTVLVLDKKTNDLIRTIPPEELKKFREGDMVALFT